MRKTRTWLFFFLPLLYLSIVLGFIAFQFSKKSDAFSQSLGDLTISGKTSSGGQPAELALRGRGLEFVFDPTHVLQAQLKDGSSTRLRPLSWAWNDGNVVVSFQEGFQLAFDKTDVGGRSLLIRPVSNEASKRISVLHIPFAPESGARLNRPARKTLLEITQGKQRVLASVDGVLDRIEADNTFVLVAGKNGFRPARLDPLAPGITPEFAWLTLDGPPDTTAAEAALTQYWDKAYASWSTSSAFSTRLVDAWGREALVRGDYPAAFNKIQSLLSRTSRVWGFEAVSYLGNMVELTAVQRRNVEAASSRSQPDWTGQGRLWFDARLYGPEGSVDRVKELLLAGNLPESPAGLLAMFQNLQAMALSQPSEAVSERIKVVLKSLTGFVVRREGELFVQTGEGLLDLRSNLILGRLWLDYSRTLSNEAYGPVGAQLIVSALARQETTGRLPEILVTQDGQIVRQEGTLLAEDLYALVKPAPPVETELVGWGAGAFVRTPGRLVSQSITSSLARFTLRFPAGSAEHVIISGVPPFDHITLHGIRWRTDPQFQSYTDGWYYSASTKTLYLKIKHREDLEEVVVHFQPEQ